MHNLELDTRIDQRWKSLEKIRSKTILMDNQIILDFRVNSSQSLWRITLNTLSVICSVKNVNPRKKPHPNRLTLSNARASHVSKNLFRWKSIKVVVFFKAARNYDCNSEHDRIPRFYKIGKMCLNTSKYYVQHINRKLFTHRIWICEGKGSQSRCMGAILNKPVF